MVGMYDVHVAHVSFTQCPTYTRCPIIHVLYDTCTYTCTCTYMHMQSIYMYTMYMYSMCQILYGPLEINAV